MHAGRSSDEDMVLGDAQMLAKKIQSTAQKVVAYESST